jgi:GNAT superfamily N-acetyltransferase
MLLRAAEPSDAMAVACVHVRSWQVGYRGMMPDEYLDALRPEDRARHYTFGQVDPAQPATILAEEDGVIFGFATSGPSPDPDQRGTGELYALYVDPAAWGSGVGRALIGDARGRLGQLGFSDAGLWVLAGNERAARFYRRDGWTFAGRERVDDVWGVTVAEVRYRRSLP